MNPITKKEIRSILSKNKIFTDLKTSFIFRMGKFSPDFPNAIEIHIAGILNFKILTCNNGWKDDLNENKISVPIRNKYRVSGLYSVKDYYDTILDNLCSYIADYLRRHTVDLQYKYISLASVSLEDINKYSYMDLLDMIVWSDNKVGVWYVEQECGEGWIVLPRNYKQVDNPEYKYLDYE